MKQILHILFFSLLFASCTTVEKSANTETDDSETEVTADPRPDWYDYTNRSYADSASFTGVGMAAAADESEAREEARKQAVARTRLAIDSYVENIREESTDQMNTDQFSSASFIMELRNTVHSLPVENDLEITEEHIVTDQSVHQIYIMAKIPRDVALLRLVERLDDSSFNQRLQQSANIR